MATPRKKPEDKLKTGRPTKFTQELADLICMRVATCSFGLRKMCAAYPDLPTSETIYEWRYKFPQFSSQFKEAKLKQAEFMTEELLEIADDANNDWMETLSDEEQSLGWKVNGEHVQRSRLRIDTRKWIAAKLLPKTYGLPQQEKGAEHPSVIERMLTKSD